jgi:hypothetical protein
MQQFFALINAVLAESAAARARRLRIATYKARLCGGFPNPVITLPLLEYRQSACSWHFRGVAVFAGGRPSGLPQVWHAGHCRHGRAPGRQPRPRTASQAASPLLCASTHAEIKPSRKTLLENLQVVPFSPAAGLLEWVEDTTPLSDYLTGRTRMAGAHARYRRPGDITFLDAYQAMAPRPAGERPRGRDEQRRVFTDEARARACRRPRPRPRAARPAAARSELNRPDVVRVRLGYFEGRARARQVCARFPPVMHHFFLEHHRAPAAWFEARLCYTRATAVSSMAGHVIGLGDRHSHNILLHARSGAVVHIDLGIAFEQGRFLTTPELVPFRLTRDVVDGLGAAGARARRCRAPNEPLGCETARARVRAWCCKVAPRA